MKIGREINKRQVNLVNNYKILTFKKEDGVDLLTNTHKENIIINGYTVDFYHKI